MKGTDRFTFDSTNDYLEQLKEGETPANTIKNTEWALRNFEQWRNARNKQYPHEPCPENSLISGDDRAICNWLCKFIVETRRSNGEEYTPRSLYLLLAGIQRYMRNSQGTSSKVNIFQDDSYIPLKNVCDSIFKRLHARGIGTEIKATAVLSPEDENTLWESGVLNIHTPKGLLNAVFFYNGKNFCLRGGQEQRNLRFSQVKRELCVIEGRELTSYVYTEYGSKNHQGGFNSFNLKNKVVRQHESLTDTTRCHVHILDKYFAVVPREVKNDQVFYLKPLSEVPSDPTKPWFTKTPIGRNRLNVMLKEMCQEAGIEGHYTNHSL